MSAVSYATSPDIREAGDADIAAYYDLMRQLRPHLATEAEFVTRWRRQTMEGYRIVALWADGQPRALAGFRVLENLIHGRFVYVDDLVADARLRSRGLGETLLRYLKDWARAQDCHKLVLDTALDNTLGHRFYYRQGLLAMALRFHAALV